MGKLAPAVNDRVELRCRHRRIDETPLRGRMRWDLLAEQDDLARAPFSDEQRQPLRCAAGRH